MNITLAQIIRWFNESKTLYIKNKDHLTELDSAIGDADHGINMARGFTAVVDMLEQTPPSDIGDAFKKVATTLIKTVGGASGPLYGTFFLKMAVGLAGKTEITLAELTDAIEKGVNGVIQLGKAETGDKTMIDVWLPVLESLKKSTAENKSVKDALGLACKAAESGLKATIPLVAKKGRASYLGERSVGHQDPGATSSWLLLTAAFSKLG